MIRDDTCVVLQVAGVNNAVRRTPLPLVVDGEAVDYLADPIAHEAVVSDDGDPDALVARTACAVRELLRPEPKDVTCNIEPISDRGRPVPLLPQSDYPSLFARHRARGA